MTVPPIAILKLLRSARNSSGWPSLNMDMFILYVYGLGKGVFLHILTLMVLLEHYSSSYTVMSKIGGDSIHACTSALIQL